MPFKKGFVHPDQGSASGYAEWLKGHHRIVTYTYPEPMSEESPTVHVFSIETQPVFVKNNNYSATVAIPSGPSVLTLDLTFKSVKDLAVTAYITIPLLPPIKLGHIEGNIDKGIRLEVRHPICAGGLLFYSEFGNVLVERSLRILDEDYGGDIKLVADPSAARFA